MIIPLSKQQKEIMQDFYRIPATKVIFNKDERNVLWKMATKRNSDLNFDLLREKCPALLHQIQKSYVAGNNIQSAVFSECVYAQTFANMMGLNIFVNCYDNNNFIPDPIVGLLASYHLVPRYAYSTTDKKRILIQAGGCNGIDSALFTVFDLSVYTIEFKEPGAKTTEPDLPKYKEDGILTVTGKWLKKYPQFKAMLEEQEGLNFFEIMGHNVHNFTKESIDLAVSNCYVSTKKYADVICTEDIKGNLVMIPTNQVTKWADIEGEIHPAGRNHCGVWTLAALKKFLLQKGASIDKDIVTINKNLFQVRKERGGNGKISGYKVNPIFFIYAVDCTENKGNLIFDINKMRQLKPTIAGKMFFKKLLHSDVKTYYGL